MSKMINFNGVDCQNILKTSSLFTHIQTMFCKLQTRIQDTKKFRSKSLALVDFVVGLVEFILHLPAGLVKVFRKSFL